MSDTFTPAPATIANSCTQSPAPVFCCTTTTRNKVNNLYPNDAKRCGASFSFITTTINNLNADCFMKNLLRKSGMFVMALLIANLFFVGVGLGQATVTSDKPDYAPLSNAVFTGSGFLPNENVVLKVKNLT